MICPAQNKAERLRQIEALLLAHPEGMTQADLAARLGVHRSTILRCLPSLSDKVYQDGNRHFIDREAYLVNLSLSLHEAVAMHLAARLLAGGTDRQNPHAAAALRKLGLAVENLAGPISRHMLQAADSIDDAARRQDPAYLAALVVLTQGWAEGRKVDLQYRSEAGTAIHCYTFSPCFIEPYAAGRTTYAFGWIDPDRQRRTFKVERIEHAALSGESFDLPVDFDPADLLGDAWGIWYTDGEPVEVVLKFSPQVARRVGETRWHRSEQVEPLEDGSLLWRAWIAEPREMMYWVRGWGADVEVVKPEGLRRAMIAEAEKLREVYAEEG